MRLELLPERFAVCLLPPEAALELPRGAFASLTRTPDEVSLVCEEAFIPEGAKVEPGWRALKVVGPLEFSAVGVLASLASPLAEADISIFVISTFDTDYLFVKENKLREAVRGLEGAGHAILPH